MEEELYGISRGDADYIFSTFPVLRTREEKELGEYRTRRLVLEQYDALAAVRLSTPRVGRRAGGSGVGKLRR